ncbi:MAG TPA: DUF4139 domain-containing protein [Bryobacteraceae bacterium]|nr:DUF4139 domain-containing protein [Bryobacteraceae bacterium]
MRRIVFCILAAALGAAAAELPVTQVVLYKHGVGFFERSGTLGPGQSARLDFDASEMNDVLKSLTIQERGGGKISGLRYDAMDPLSHTLAQFPFKLDGAQPLSGMLDQLKGSHVELKLGNETVTGTIVNARELAATQNQSGREQLTLMLDSGDLRTFDMGAVTGLHFPDAQLQQQFKDYLAALAAARSKEKRSVYIDSTDDKQRQVVASYMIPAPVWKSSYRLIFGAEGKPVLEGWAIVDNTTGEDWNKVQLSLVSGRPISFVSQLYAPKYLARPEVELPDDNAARPVVHSGAYASTGSGSGGGIGSGRGGAVGGVLGSIASAAPPPARAMRPSAGINSLEQFGIQEQASPVEPSSLVLSSTGSELGELFEYRIGQPVTIRKNESAMLPFLQQSIDVRKLLIYSDHSSPHPTNAAELTNATGKTLDGGPITVYDGGAYGGEALMETLKVGDKRLISYAVDLGTRITEAFGGKQAVVREIHFNRGILTAKLAAEETRTYTARNVDQKAKTLIIEHPLRHGYTLLNQKPLEKTPSNYRFEIALAANGMQEFGVAEERVYDQAFQVSNMTPDVLLAYVRNRDLPDASRRQLQRIADQKQQVAETERALADAQTATSELTSDEDRIRRNIESLNNVSGQQQQVQNYARQLDAHEQQLAALRDKTADLQKKKAVLQTDLDNLVATLAF